MNKNIKIYREFGMQSRDTFICVPIKSFVMKYLKKSKISIDPFARNFSACTYTNDLNPNTTAQYHLKAEKFLEELIAQGIKADLVIFDPPYSMAQCKRTYENYGYDFTYEDSLYVIRWTKEKNLIIHLLGLGGIFLHFGWHTNGMGMKRGFTINEIMLACHGSAKYDTICMAEERTSEQYSLFPVMEKNNH